MRPEERENRRYSTGSVNPIDIEEDVLFSFLPNGDGKNLLDVGCGIGTIGLELKKKGFQVSGVDFSEVGIKKCLELGLDAKLSDIDADGLKFNDKSFDVVWAGDVIEHVFDPIFLFEEIYRVLKDDGCLLATVPNNFYMRKRWKIFISGKSMQSGVYRKSGQCKHHTFFSWELLCYMLEKSKMYMDRYSSVYRLPKSKIRRITANKTIGRLFGRKFIFSARKRI
jgi:ubiquinone/menaquinone biosynthesis C-methylase UbiE